MSRLIGDVVVFSNYLPLQIWTLRICNHYISKIITAWSFKLGQLIDLIGLCLSVDGFNMFTSTFCDAGITVSWSRQLLFNDFSRFEECN